MQGGITISYMTEYYGKPNAKILGANKGQIRGNSDVYRIFYLDLYAA